MLQSHLFQLLAFFIAASLSPAGAREAGDELGREEITKITAICRSLLGVEDWRPKEIFAKKLSPYIRSKKALEASNQVECSFHCGGTLLLRGGGVIWYGFPNQPINVTHRIDTVAFHIHGKRIFAVGPGIDYYPYPYYDTKARKR
jgi:hypothetical protein